MSKARPMSDPEAVSVVNEMLEQTRLAAFTRDFDLFLRWCEIPHVITTFEAKRTVTTKDEMKTVFDAQCDNFAALQVTDMIRFCETAHFDGPDRIQEMHTTNLMSGDRRVIDPYPAFMVLVRQDGKWRVSKSDYAIKAGSGFEKALRKVAQSTSRLKDSQYEQ